MPFVAERSAQSAPSLDVTLSRLGALAGVEVPRTPGPERAMLLAALPALSGLAASGLPLVGLLSRLIVGPRFDGEPSLRSLPRPAQKALKAGEVFASADADVWILEEQPDGTARISHAHPESFEVLGETLAAWLAAEVDRLISARAPKSKKSAAGAVGKPAIDAALARLACTDVSATLAALALGKNDTRWHYLLRAVAACGPAWSPALLAKLEGRLLGRVLTGRLNDTEDETCLVEPGDDDLDGVNPIYVDRYPAAAKKVLTSGHFVAASGPEVWLQIRDAKGAKMSWDIHLFHTAPEGFESLGTLEAWLAYEVARVDALGRAG